MFVGLGCVATSRSQARHQSDVVVVRARRTPTHTRTHSHTHTRHATSTLPHIFSSPFWSAPQSPIRPPPPSNNRRLAGPIAFRWRHRSRERKKNPVPLRVCVRACRRRHRHYREHTHTYTRSPIHTGRRHFQLCSHTTEITPHTLTHAYRKRTRTKIDHVCSGSRVRACDSVCVCVCGCLLCGTAFTVRTAHRYPPVGSRRTPRRVNLPCVCPPLCVRARACVCDRACVPSRARRRHPSTCACMCGVPPRTIPSSGVSCVRLC